MNLRWRKLGFISSFFLFASCFALASQTPTTLVLVDKKTNQLHLSQYLDGNYKILKTYHTTLGQVKGDKEDENDLKTPEGIYTFNSIMAPPQLPAKYGVMGYCLNFPNAFDHIAGRRGSGIMLHATDDPERLKKNYDSRGCVVVKNEEIMEIKSQVRLGLTPILIFQELTEEFLHPGQDSRLVSFFKNWIQSWETKNVDQYIDSYHSEFSAQGKDKGSWKKYKERLNSLYSSIQVNPKNVLYYRHPKYSMVTFTQNYHSTLKSGRVGHHSTGTKILYIAEEAGQLKIIAETFTNLMW